MKHAITHSVSLTEDRKTIRLVLMSEGTDGLSAKLKPADVDLLLDALSELREQMIDRFRHGPFTRLNRTSTPGSAGGKF